MRQEKPEYLKLYELLRDEIIQGAWPYGARLPSRRQIAVDRGLSAITVEHSYELLCQEGYAEARPRSGYYVCYRRSDGFAAVEPASPRRPLVMPSPGEDAFPFSALARSMRRVLTDYGETLLEKSPNCGCDELRRALSGYLSRNRGIQADARQIIIGSGSEYLYGLVVEMLGRERVFAIEDPSYEKIERVYQAKGVVCDPLPLGSDGIISSALAGTKGSVLHITPFRSYPTGVTASASKRAEYLYWASEGDRFIVEDDFESEFSMLRKPEETVFSRSASQNVIYLNTFTRTISPAIRVSYMVLPPRMVPLFDERVGFYSCTVPTFEQYVLTDLIRSGDFERHINRIRRRMRKQARGTVIFRAATDTPD
ncbi:MAG: PLP-dependent aminotransferase family protein [Clostridia bacterium]|nr:PLP-dependent aminotransferase family protein [Clostridia bacterium]